VIGNISSNSSWPSCRLDGLDKKATDIFSLDMAHLLRLPNAFFKQTLTYASADPNSERFHWLRAICPESKEGASHLLWDRAKKIRPSALCGRRWMFTDRDDMHIDRWTDDLDHKELVG
jgi:hypothetical protein